MFLSSICLGCSNHGVADLENKSSLARRFQCKIVGIALNRKLGHLGFRLDCVISLETLSRVVISPFWALRNE